MKTLSAASTSVFYTRWVHWHMRWVHWMRLLCLTPLLLASACGSDRSMTLETLSHSPAPPSQETPHDALTLDGISVSYPTARCAGDASLCLGVRYVVYRDPEGLPIENEIDATLNLDAVNRIWAECGIQYQIDEFLAVDPERESLRYATAHTWELEEIRERFHTERSLLVTITGPWDRRGTLGHSWANAWTSLPGGDFAGAILERPVGRDANILAHELGDYLNLDHVSESTNLMSPLIDSQTELLDPDQCENARWAARHFWPRMLR